MARTAVRERLDEILELGEPRIGVAAPRQDGAGPVDQTELDVRAADVDPDRCFRHRGSCSLIASSRESAP